MSLALASPSLKTARAPISASTCGQRILAALPLLWAKSVSLHDAAGNIYWEQGEAQGPAQREAIRLAIESFAGRGAAARISHPLRQDRTALLLRAENDTDVFLGFVMLVVDDRWLRGKACAAPDLPVPVVRAVREWAATLSCGAQGTISREPGLSALPASEPRVDDLEAARYLEKLQSFQLEFHAQRLTPIQPGIRLRRYEIQMSEVGLSASASALEELNNGAEALGLGAAIDRRVLGDLLAWLAQRMEIWSDEPAQFSVRLNSASLHDSNFLHFVELCLEKAQLPPELLAIEVQHEFCQCEPQCFARLAAQLEQAGAGVAIDNFTLSEAGIDALLQPGVRLVRLDPKLTDELLNDRGAQARVAAIAQAARVAGVHVVAQHVVDTGLQTLLQALGVDFMQGLGVDAAAPLEEIDPLFNVLAEEDGEPRFAATG